MKKKQILTLALISSLAMTSLTGCGMLETFFITSDTLAENYNDTMKTLESVELDFSYDMDITISEDSTSMDMTIDGIDKLKYTSDRDDYIAEMNSKIKMSMMGITETTKTSAYTICEDDEINTYIKDISDEYSYWYEDNSDVSEILEDVLNLDISYFDLEKETEYVNKKDCYVLTSRCEYEEFQLGNEFDISFNDVFADITVYMDKESKVPVSIVMDVDTDDINDNISDAFVEMFDIENGSFEFNKLLLTYDLDNINDDIDIEVPMDEIKNDIYAGFATSEPITDNPTEPIETFKPEIVEKPEPEIPSNIETLELDNLIYDNIQYKENINFEKHKVYLMLVNYNDKDVCYYVTAHFYNNGIEVYDSSRYFQIEAETFLAEDFWCESNFDNVVYEVEKEDVYSNYLGSEIDVYYTFSEDILSGTIENNTIETLSYPLIRYIIFDKNNDIIDCGYTYAKDDCLLPGETSEYLTYMDTEFNSNWGNYVVYVTADEKEEY